MLPAVSQAIPGTDHVEKIEDDLYRAWGDSVEENLLGYVAIGEATGYGGPMLVAAGLSPEGEIIGAAIASHMETPSWINRVLGDGYIDRLLGKPYTDAFTLGEDVDGITSATYTSRAIADAMLKGSHIAATYVGLPIEEQAKPEIVFGAPEIILLLLFATGIYGRRPGTKHRKYIRWASMLVGLVALGFVYNSPLTIVYINKLLMGFWPQWQTHLYWYILIAGILFVFSVDNKNPYCSWFCPFGAAQECMGAVGGAKARSAGRYRGFLKWLQRGLAWAAIFLALIYRNPGISSFEVFGTLFKFIGSGYQFAILGIILVASLFIYRPWCNYLCPLRPVEEVIRKIRKWIIGLWTKRKTA